MIQLFANGWRLLFERSTFPGGEVHIALTDQLVPTTKVKVLAHLHSSDDVMALLMLTDALRRAGIEHIDLRMPYLPYARQDRVCLNGEALSLRVFCDLINAQRYASVEVWDVHSDVALALLDRVTNVHCATLLTRNMPFDRRRTVLVAPDAGAIKKVSAVGDLLEMRVVRADKTRAGGLITGTVVYTEHIGDRDFLIVDDICDGGRTFIELAKVLRPLTSGAVMLYVTHGIFSKGTAVFDGLIDKVIVANSFVDALPSNFHLIKD